MLLCLLLVILSMGDVFDKGVGRRIRKLFVSATERAQFAQNLKYNLSAIGLGFVKMIYPNQKHNKKDIHI